MRNRSLLRRDWGRGYTVELLEGEEVIQRLPAQSADELALLLSDLDASGQKARRVLRDGEPLAADALAAILSEHLEQ